MSLERKSGVLPSKTLPITMCSIEILPNVQCKERVESFRYNRISDTPRISIQAVVVVVVVLLLDVKGKQLSVSLTTLFLGTLKPPKQ